MREARQGLALALSSLEACQVVLPRRISAPEQPSGFGEGPCERRLAELLARGAIACTGGGCGTLDEAAIGHARLYPGQAVAVVDRIAEDPRADLPHARERAPAVAGLGLGRLGGVDAIALQLGHQTVRGSDQRAVQREALRDGGLGQPCSHACPVGLIGQLFAALRKSILAGGLRDMRQPRCSLTHEMDPAPQEVRGHTPRGGIGVGLGQPPAAEEYRKLVGVNRVVLGRPAVNGLHIAGMAQDIGKPRGGAEVGQPVPSQDTFDAPDSIVPVRGNRRQERLGGRCHLAVEPDLSILVEEAKGQRARVQVDAPVKLVGLRVEAPEVSSAIGW
jgi:hypothetical protein